MENSGRNDDQIPRLESIRRIADNGRYAPFQKKKNLVIIMFMRADPVKIVVRIVIQFKIGLDHILPLVKFSSKFFFHNPILSKRRNEYH